MESLGVKLKLLPRFHGIALDYNARSSGGPNVIFWHGVKNENIVLRTWKTDKDNMHGKMTIHPLCKLK